MTHRVVLRARAAAFTLVELLVVVVVLGILILAVVPQFTDHTNDARLAAIDRDLEHLRQAIDLYYQQHGAYPGQTDPSSGAAPAADAHSAFVEQLTRYTDANGVVAAERDATFRYGPYLRSTDLPVNPFRGDNTLAVDTATSNLTADLYDGGSAWKFAVQIGKLVANSAPEHSQR